MLKEHLTPKDFAEEIENLVRRRQLNYIEAVLDYCERNDLAPEAIPSMLTTALKEKLQANAIELHFLPKSTKALKFK
jgi:hypothetical protein